MEIVSILCWIFALIAIILIIMLIIVIFKYRNKTCTIIEKEGDIERLISIVGQLTLNQARTNNFLNKIVLHKDAI